MLHISHQKYYGNGETFVFSLYPNEEAFFSKKSSGDVISTQEYFSFGSEGLKINFIIEYFWFNLYFEYFFILFYIYNLIQVFF